MKLLDLDETIEQLEKKNHSIKVLSIIKSGKEAMVYKVLFDNLVAALKLYKNRGIRSFRNIDPYIKGKFVKSPNMRKAILQKNKVGKDFVQKGWVKREYNMLSKLYDVGCSLPKPLEFTTNALVMEYLGDEINVAPIIKSIELSGDEARVSFDIVIKNMQLFLDNGIVHSDLSEFNILYWKDKPYIIDFPQSVNIKENPNAEQMLLRDCHNVCKYFSKFIEVDEQKVTNNLVYQLKLITS